MKQMKRAVAIALVTCLLLALLPAAALAGTDEEMKGTYPIKWTFLPGVHYPGFTVGDTSSADKLMFTISGNERTTASGVERATAVSFDWWIEDNSGGKFEFFEMSTNQPIAQLPTENSPRTVQGQSLSIYVGIKQGEMVTREDNMLARLHFRMHYTTAVVGANTGSNTSSGWWMSPSPQTIITTDWIRRSINVNAEGSVESGSSSFVSDARQKEMAEKLESALTAAKKEDATLQSIIQAINSLKENDFPAFIACILKDGRDEYYSLESKAKQLASYNGSTSISGSPTGFGTISGTTVTVQGAGFNAQTSSDSLALQFATAQTPQTLTGTTAGIIYDPASIVPLDITLQRNGSAISNPQAPIMITMPLPNSYSASDNVEVLHETSGGWERLPSVVSGNNCSFVTGSFSTFVFVKRTGYVQSSKKSSDAPAPIVPILYDITKPGDYFKFKVFIANASGNMAGATVTVKLNNKYTTSVTIAQDGVGLGTLEAPGFAGSVANFSARVDGVSSAYVTKPMVVGSSGRVMTR